MTTSRTTRKIALEEAFTFAPFADDERKLTSSLNPSWGAFVDGRIADLADLRLAEMDAAGIDVQVLSLTSPGIQTMPDAADAVRVAREANDLVADAVRRHPDRFAAFAALACQDPDAAVAELERCVTQLSFVGALVNGHTNGVYLDDDSLLGVWEAAESLGVPIYLHPAEPATPFAVCDGYPLQAATFGWAFETGAHALRVVLGGIFERFPAATLIVGHMGENLPYSLARLDDRYDFYVADSPLGERPSFYVKRNIMVTTSGVNDAAPLRCAIDVMGADRVLFAVDYPYQHNEPAVAFIDSAPITDEERTLICSGNAERLLGL
ncbi:MAG: amidohydrolase [Acidimicrobiales bacterium]|nr:amidohydrolase [Acidimicrobiales bacterium]